MTKKRWIAALAAAITVVATTVIVSNSSDAAAPKTVRWFSGIVFVFGGYGVYVTNNTGTTQKATVSAHDESATPISPDSAISPDLTISPHAAGYLPYSCVPSSTTCGYSFVITTHSKRVVPSLDIRTVTQEAQALPAGTFVTG